MAHHHRPPLSASGWSGNFRRGNYRSAQEGGQVLTPHPVKPVSVAEVKPAPVDLPFDLKGKTEFLPDAGWRDALAGHLQCGRVAQARAQLNNWRKNADHTKYSLSLLCDGETRRNIQDVNFGLFSEHDFERVMLRGVTFKNATFPEGGEAFKRALEARGAVFAGYRIGQQPYVPATPTANARGSQGR